MGQFTVRVELHRASTSQDYEELHEAMEAKGFSRTFVSNDGDTCHLPTAEYRYHNTTETRAQVLDKAYNVAKAIKPKPAVIVTEGPLTSRGLVTE
jgi:hypothetical protein